MVSKGEFIKEKLGNMARWVDEELGSELNAAVDCQSALAATVFASRLLDNRHMVTARNWSGITHLATNEVPELGAVLQDINRHERLHEKFWRYMDMFVEVAAQ